MVPKQYLIPERRPNRSIPQLRIDDESNALPDFHRVHAYSLALRNSEDSISPIPERGDALRDTSSRLYGRHLSQGVDVNRSNTYAPSPNLSNDEDMGNAVASADQVPGGRGELLSKENFYQHPSRDQQTNRLNVSIPSSSGHDQVTYTPSPHHQRNTTSSPTIAHTYNHALYPVATDYSADHPHDSLRNFNRYDDSRHDFNTRIPYDDSFRSQVGNSGPHFLVIDSPVGHSSSSFAIPIRRQDPPCNIPIHRGAYFQEDSRISRQYMLTETPYSSTGSYPPVHGTLAESEKPGHDPQYSRRRRKPPSGKSTSSATLSWDNDMYLTGPQNIAGGSHELRYPRNGFNVTGSHTGIGSTGFMGNQFYRDTQMAVDPVDNMSPNPANFAGSSDISTSQNRSPEPYEELDASFLSFIMSAENHYLLVDLPAAIAMEDLKTSYWSRMGNLSPYNDSVNRLFDKFQASIGSPRNRADRDKKQKVDKNEIQKRCPISRCTGRFTRSNGLKNHLASHFKLTLRRCPTCSKALTLSSFRRHVKGHTHAGNNLSNRPEVPS